jgi:acyl-CoA dehydrogenase
LDFALPREAEAVRLRARAFVDERLLPLEDDPASFGEGEHVREGLLAGLREEARARGLWCPQMPRARGGQGLPAVGMAAVYEELGRSRFGPVACNCAAPDDGNMLVLERLGTPGQKERWLQPVADGRARSSIAMTEPPPGAGSDPGGMMLTRAERVGDAYVVRGRKWWTTGAQGASHFLLLARTSDDPRRGLTAMMFHADRPGWRIVRRIPIMGPEEHGGHCELEIDGLEVPVGDVLLGEGLGMRVVQARLAIARLTHCMRWLGMARRALEIALPHVRGRRAFGQALAEKEGVQGMLGEAAMGVEVGRLLTMRAAAELDRGGKARKEFSMAKVQVAEALHRAVDTAIQLLGARGYSRDTPLEWMYRYARQARLVDGASEVHRMVVARELLRPADGGGGDGPAEFFAWS